jgi:hypothetical protein
LRFTISATVFLLNPNSRPMRPYPRQNGLALALREIGRIERTVFMLDWLELPGLRRQATVELNKGEARNALARAVCFRRLGRLCDRAVEAQQYRASGLALVTAAIALWNTVYLDRALNDLRCGGEMIPEALLPTLPPSAGSTSILPAIICGMPISASLRTGSERFARQQQAFARPLPPDPVPDLVLLTVLSCPFYGVTPNREGRHGVCNNSRDLAQDIACWS